MSKTVLSDIRVMTERGCFVSEGRYCSLVMSREVFFVSEGHRKPRHTARIYAISIILCIAKRVTENGVNSN